MQPISHSVLSKYPVQVPRYTSYPTAPHFHTLSTGIHESWIRDIAAATPISLYVHIPYCKKLCWFCGCNTQITQKYGPVESYLELLFKEIRLVAGKMGRRQLVSHIHFGGGSPTLLTPQDFEQVMVLLGETFTIQPGAVIAIEADPRGMSEAKMASYAKHGVNRISIGVQDFDPAVQEAVSRIQPFRTVYNAVRTCHEYGVDDISIDLIYGLPKQNLESFKQTLEYTLLLDPGRIALFGYAHVPWKKKNMRLISEDDLPDANERFAMFDAATACFKAAGYVPIGLDHFAKCDDSMAVALKEHRLRRNFQGYTTDKSEVILGLGASAISSFAQGYVQNATSVDTYEKALSSGTLATARGFSLSAEDLLRRSIINSLMCYFEADIASLCEKVGQQVSMFDDVFLHLKQMQADGLLILANHHIRIHTDFPQAMRLVCAAFDRYFLPNTVKHAQIA
ncbi:MAG: oxygen-independent coproporphyrinogen III oxidase [Rickettsiales bacterium]|nr:oxygen-independent coproporphyrinogen III oxidase [Rickettsiales bacterium]